MWMCSTPTVIVHVCTYVFYDSVLEVGPALDPALQLGVEHVGGRTARGAELELRLVHLTQLLPVDDLKRGEALQQISERHRVYSGKCNMQSKVE
jgi:hypothetical protein